ncbi:MAG: hypothetical protein J5589_02240 [Firmicutes bacterium]|nr:hypothetical protein [Bacillota bacterium]
MGSTVFSGEVWTNVHPDIMERLFEINSVPVDGKVGHDSYTKKARELMQAQFDGPVWITETVNGTAANILALKCLLKPWSSIVCADVTHINTHECGAAEFNLGAKVLSVPAPAGKLTPALVEDVLDKNRAYHLMPTVLVLTQPTEYGVLYSVPELRELTEMAHENGMEVYIDGARLPFALQALGIGLKEMIEEPDIDAFSFGGTKCGAMFAEMVVFRREKDKDHLQYLQKQTLQHFDKSKFLGVQLEYLLEDENWRRIAKQMNETAGALASRLAEKGIRPVYPVDTNMVFVQLSEDQLSRVRTVFDLHYWDQKTKAVRLCCSHETTINDIEKMEELL